MNDGASATLPCIPATISSVLIIDAHGVIRGYNSAASDIVGENALGELFVDKLSDAVKFGLISNAAIAKILASIEKGTGTFRAEDGRTFLLQRIGIGEDRHLEWTDVSSVVASATAIDEATGLLTRQGFLQATRDLPTESGETVVFHIDLDDFRDTVDLVGSAIVDHLVRRVADRISAQLDPASGHLAHGTGAEFFFVSSGEEASILADAVLEMLGRPYLVDGAMIYATASIGIARCGHGEDIENVVRNAGLALKKAKAGGGNQTCIFTPEMRQAIQRRRDLEVELRKALALREFSVAYQPQYQIEGRRLVGFEALLRWNHPVLGSVSPSEFIPLAEQLGLIVQVGEWVLRVACRKAASWPGGISISVNVSPLQFRSETMVATVTAALKSSGLAPERLDLEVTEGAILMNSEPVMETFRQLKALGIRFSMDDFGTGYSSLSYLQKFPFDKIKIDQSFVRGLSANEDSLTIIRSICALGKALGLTTIAEGVETEEQLTRIRKKGCQQVQGYLTGRPMAPELADQLVASQA